MTTPAETIAVLLEMPRGAFYDAMAQVIGDFNSYLTSTSVAVLDIVLKALILYCDYGINRTNVYNHGLLPLLINLVMDTKTDDGVARKALRVLRSCSSDVFCKNLCSTHELMHRVFGFTDMEDMSFTEVVLAFINNIYTQTEMLFPCFSDLNLVSTLIGFFADQVASTVGVKLVCLTIITNFGMNQTLRYRIADDHDITKLLEAELTACDTLVEQYPQYLIQVLRCINCFASVVKLKVPFAKCGILPRLIHCLNSANSGVVSNVLGALSNIATSHANKPLFLKVNLTRIISTLSRNGDDFINRQLARLYMALTEHEIIRWRLGKTKQVHDALMRMLRSENKQVYIYTCEAIANLMLEDEINKSFVTASLVERLCQLFCRTDSESQNAIIRCLCLCSFNIRTKGLIRSWRGIHTHLFQCLRSSNHKLHINAAGIIANLAIGSDHFRLYLSNANIVQVLVYCINSEDFAINKQFARLLFVLSSSRDINDSLVKSKVIHKLVSYIQPESIIPDIQQINLNIAGTIANVAYCSKNEVLNSGAVPVMIKLACSIFDATEARKQAIRFVNIVLKNTGCVTVPGCVVDVVGEYYDSKQTPMQKRFATLFDQVLKANVGSELFDITETTTSAPLEPMCGKKRCRIDQQFIVDSLMKTRSSLDHDLTLVLPIQVDSEVKYFRFHCHQLIVMTRWKDLLSITFNNATIDNDGQMVVVFPRVWASTRDAWMRFVLYLYSNNFVFNSEIKDKSVPSASLIDLAHLAIKTNLHSVCYLLRHMYVLVKDWNNAEISKYYESNVRGKPITSSWKKDMFYLLSSPFSGSKDIQLIADSNVCHDEHGYCETVPVKRLKTGTQGNNSQGKQVILEAHQLFLTTCSDYFKTMLESPYWKNSRKNRLRIEGSTKVIRILLTYYYCGYTREINSAITSDLSLLLDVLDIANRYNCESLVAICEKKMLLSPNFNESYFYEMLQQPVITRTPVLFLACVYNFYEAVKNQKLSVQENLLRLKGLADIKSGEIESYDSFEIQIASEIESIINNWSN